MVITSGRTPAAICKQFTRNKWGWDDEIVKKFIELSQIEARKSTLIKEIETISRDTLSNDC